MVTIKYDIEAEEYKFEITPTAGDVNEVYRSQDKIRDHVESNGYEFVDEPPQYRILATKHKRSRDPTVLDLGDISGKVEPIGETEVGVTETGTEEDQPDLDPDDVEITLVAPDGTEETKRLSDSQNLGSLKADIKSSDDDITRSMRVDVYRSRERQRELPSETQLSALDGDRLFWDTTDRR